MPREIPDDWEDIDPERMRLPKSKKAKRRQRPRPRPKMAAALATALLRHCHGSRVARKAACEEAACEEAGTTAKLGRAARRRKKPKKNRQHQSYQKWCAQDDCVVERKPVFTKHAKERAAQGRCGEFVTAKKGNAVVIITILPRGEGPRKRMENIRIRENRKNKVMRYKFR